MNKMAWIIGCVLPLLVAQVRAQYTSSYQTNIIDGVTTNWTGYYIVGSNTASDVLIIRNGGVLNLGSGQYGELGFERGADNNTAIVDGTNSQWNITIGALQIGRLGANCMLIITNGGSVNGGAWGSQLAMQGYSPNDAVVVTGPSSTWTTAGINFNGGNFCRLSVLNAGAVYCTGNILLGNACVSNTILVSGINSLLREDAVLNVGSSSSSLGGDVVIITNSGTVWVRDTATNNSGVVIGPLAGEIGNRVQVDGGNLIATNAATASTLGIDVRNGTLVLNSGATYTKRLYLTNGAASVMQFTGGSLTTYGTSVSNGSSFVVGNGSNAATLNLLGGVHAFANGLTIATNAALIVGGTNAIGSATINGNLALQANTVLDLDVNQTTNDWVQVNGTATLPATGTLRARALDTAFSRKSIPVLQASSPVSGDVSGWNAVLLNGQAYHLVVSGNQVLLARVPTGSVIAFR